MEGVSKMPTIPRTPGVTNVGALNIASAPAAAPAQAASPQGNWGSILSSPEFGGVLQQIGLGILSSKNPLEGLALGIQNFNQQQRQRASDKREQDRYDQEQKRQDAEAQARQSERDYQHSRDAVGDAQYKQKWDYSVDQDALARQDKLDEQGYQHRRDSAQDRLNARIQARQDATTSAQAKADLARADYYTRKGKAAWVDEDGDGKDDDTGSDVPKGVVTAGYKTFEGDFNAYRTAVKQNDDLERLVQIAPSIQAGPGLYNSAIRGLARFTGIDIGGADIDAITEADRITAQGALDKVITDMAKQGQITESERDQAKQAIVDPSKMTSDVAVKLARAFQARNQDLIDDVEGWGTRTDYNQYAQYRVSKTSERRKSKAAPISGVVNPGATSGTQNKTSSGITWSIEP